MSETIKEAELIVRREVVGEMHLKGLSGVAIARELGISRRTVERDLKAVLEAWQAARSEAVERARILELATLQLLEREAWAGWQRSLEQGVSEKLSKAEQERAPQPGGKQAGGRQGGGSDRKRAERTIRSQNGDPRFLLLIMRCIERRARLLAGQSPGDEFMMGARVTVSEVLDELSGDPAFFEFCRRRTSEEWAEPEHA